jgi:hypothetical protein
MSACQEVASPQIQLEKNKIGEFYLDAVCTAPLTATCLGLWRCKRHETSTKWNAPRYHPLQGEPTVRGWKMTGSRSLTPKTRLGQHRCTHILTLSHFYFLLLKVVIDIVVE